MDAAQPLTAFSAYGLCELHVTQLQLNEFYAVLRAVKEGAMREGKAIQRVSRSPHWVWVVLAPVTKLRGAIDIGARTLALAAGLTDHVWSLKEVLLYRVPPGPQPQTGEAAASMDERELQQLRSAHIPAKRAEWGGDNAWGVRLTS